MSTRPHVHVTLREPHPAPPSPNAGVAEVSLDLRVFWPPTTDGIQHALRLLATAYDEAVDRMTTTGGDPS